VKLRLPYLPARLALAVGLLTSLNACAEPPLPSGEDVQGGVRKVGIIEGPAFNGHTYTSAPVEAKLGPHRFNFPANYYDDQIGPYVDGGVGITLIWPEMKPGDPGARRLRSPVYRYRSVIVSIDYVDKVPIAGLMERMTTTDFVVPADSVYRRDPIRRLDQRIPSDEVFGLTPYLIDKSKIAQFSADFERESGAPYRGIALNSEDWYVARNASGSIDTLIKCDSADRIPDGLVIDEEDLVPSGTDRIAHCTHYFVDLSDRLSIRLMYPRVILRDWKRMESTVRDVLAKYRVR